MWNVRLYKNTGLNSVNTVDKPSRLNSAAYTDLPALDILQGENLSNIRVKAQRSDVKDADFLMLQNTEDPADTFFYSVESFTSTSVDVQALTIAFDGVLTLEMMINGI